MHYCSRIKWQEQHPGEIKSEPNVLTFPKKRSMVVEYLNIINTRIQKSDNLIKEIFKCSFFNEELAEWTHDWEKDLFQEYSTSFLYGDLENTPNSIKPQEIYKLLFDLEEDDRVENIKWKGKLSPEG